MLNKKYTAILKKFQCDYNRSIEEDFAQTFAEDDSVRLFFINENQSYTDGKNIIIDPATDNLFADTEALKNVEAFLGWQASISKDPYVALKLITRSTNLHECLHLLYSDFPPHFVNDPDIKTKNEVATIASISNIIEDAYIEATGCSVYDNLEMFVLFDRISQLFTKSLDSGTVALKFGVSKEQEKEIEELVTTARDKQFSKEKLKTIEQVLRKLTLINYLRYMANDLLYPMIKQNEPPMEFEEYVYKTKGLFHEGSYAPSPAERYEYCKKIFEIIRPLIPDDSQLIDKKKDLDLFWGSGTHDGQSNSFSNTQRKGKTQEVSKRLFEDRDGTRRDPSVPPEQLQKELQDYADDQDVLDQLIEESAGKIIERKSTEFPCSPVHKDIKINEIHPQINFNLRRAYQNIYNKYRMNINFYNSRFAQLLKASQPVIEDKQIFGSGLVSTKLGDPKKRYWYRKIEGTDVPELGILFLVDGSGSMAGEMRDNTMISCLVLHEVLKKQGMSHAIIEQRANPSEPEIDVNVLVDFNGKDDQKLNIMQINAWGNSRDALALLWAENYLNKNCSADNKLIIVLSDGYPTHEIDDYYPPVSTKDTANTVKKIIHRGTKVIGIALDTDDSLECYDALKEIYPHLVSCNKIKKLTGQLLTLISRQLA